MEESNILTLGLIFAGRSEPFLELEHGVRIPLSADVLQVVATYTTDDECGDVNDRDDDGNELPPEELPFIVNANGGVATISRCRVVRVTYPTTFYVLAAHSFTCSWYPKRGTWRDGGRWVDVVMSLEDAVSLCWSSDALVTDEQFAREVELLELRTWDEYLESRRVLDDPNGGPELITDEPGGLSIRYNGRVAKFPSNQGVACRLVDVMLPALLIDEKQELTVAEVAARVGFRARDGSNTPGPRWCYNVCRAANPIITSLDLGYELDCPAGSPVVRWRQLID